MTRIGGVVLGGGAARRMGGIEKGLAPFQGRPLIAPVLERLLPQVAGIAINSNAAPARYAAFPYPVIADRLAGTPGPAAGIDAALAWGAAEGFAQVALVPCDAPRFPPDLVARLAAAGRAAMASFGGQVEPLFSLWPIEAAADIRALIAADPSIAPRRLLARLGAAAVEFAPDANGASPFANLNDPEALNALAASLR